ncbi:MAG: peptidylprolyl isomerase [Planctomycetes bacterium]|nr:peptidylprolyl isomerase [Planctomycetota bacterium]
MTLHVNGEPIPEKEIREEIDRLRPHHDRAFAEMPIEEREKQLFDWSRENCVERALLRQAARRDPEPLPAGAVEGLFREHLVQRGEDAPPPEDEEAIRRDIELQLRIDRFLERLTADLPAPTGEEILAFYEEHIEEFRAPEMVRVSHIVKHLEPGSNLAEARKAMENILKRIRKIGDFEGQARRHSDCADRGGDLGYFARGRMVPSFEEVVFALKVGETSDVFQTEYGLHIAQVTDRKPAGPRPLEEVREDVTRAIADDRRRKRVEEFLDGERAKATVEER